MYWPDLDWISSTLVRVYPSFDVIVPDLVISFGRPDPDDPPLVRPCSIPPVVAGAAAWSVATAALNPHTPGNTEQQIHIHKEHTSPSTSASTPKRRRALGSRSSGETQKKKFTNLQKQ